MFLTRALTVATSLIIYPALTSQAEACYHFKVWRYPWPQRCSYEQPARVYTAPVAPKSASVLSRIDMSAVHPYYRSWEVWRAEQIAIPIILIHNYTSYVSPDVMFADQIKIPDLLK